MGVERDAAVGSGLITATVQEIFEPLHTGYSLIFTIAPNGHVWGKRLDEKSGKNDIEIEIFALGPGGCRFGKRENYREGLNATYTTQLFAPANPPKLTAEQERKINLILSQKERINYLLGTLMLKSYEISLVGNYHHRYSDGENFERPLINPEELLYKVRVVDCSYDPEPKKSALDYWDLVYFDSQFVFQFNPRQTLRCNSGGPLITPGEVLDFSEARFGVHFIDEVKEYPRVEFFAVQAENEKFDLRNWYHKTLPPKLKIMYGEYDFFGYFLVDDAVLLLEEERLSETESKFYWTIGVAQNKLARNLMRLKSNNPELRCISQY